MTIMHRTPTGMVAIVAGVLLAQSGPSVAEQPQDEQQFGPPTLPGSMAPNVFQAGDTVYLTWIEPVGDESESPPESRSSMRALRMSRLRGGVWDEPITIVQRDDFFANWADLPSVSVMNDGALIAHWLQRSGDATYAYDVIAAMSEDDGASWSTLGPIHSDGTQTEHGFVSFVPEPNAMRVFWLDGREMAEDAQGHGAMTLRTARIAETISEDTVIDPRICECCNTAAAMTTRGPIIVYRDRDEHELRDISIVRREAGAWTAPQPVHDDGWRMAACPVNGPDVAAAGDSVVVAWYTGATTGGSVRAAFSADSGASFSRPVEVDSDFPEGRVSVELLSPTEAIVIWIAPDTARQAEIMARRIAADGRMGPAVSLARASRSRQSGFPKTAVVDESLILVWTQTKPDRRVRVKRVPLSAIGSSLSAP